MLGMFLYLELLDFFRYVRTLLAGRGWLRCRYDVKTGIVISLITEVDLLSGRKASFKRGGTYENS